jgi:hypothetical protein
VIHFSKRGATSYTAVANVDGEFRNYGIVERCDQFEYRGHAVKQTVLWRARPSDVRIPVKDGFRTRREAGAYMAKDAQ